MRRLASSIATVLLFAASHAAAQVGIDESSSILVYPKVIADGTRDTTIHVGNTSNSAVVARCYYVNAAPLNPSLPPHPVTNPPLWQTVDFTLSLTALQPTIWLASVGRPVDSADVPCSFFADDFECYGAGFDPGIIPPVPPGFVGELVCVETDAAGDPLPGNHFTGAATIKDIASGDVSRYRAIGALGNELNDGDDALCLGGPVSPQCPNGAEYDACPEYWLIDVRAEGSGIAGVSGSEISTDLTVVPCARDFDSQIPASVVLQYTVRNEFEQQLTTFSSTTGWSNRSLSSINVIWDSALLGTPTGLTRIRTASGAGGVMVVAEESASIGAGVRAGAAVNAHVQGVQPGGDVIRLSAF